MAKRVHVGGSTQKDIEQYDHKDKERLNNPPVGLVDAHTDNGGLKKKKYDYDPHLDPSLQWAGKTEHTSFEVPTVSLHVHERIDPRKIIETVKKEEEIYQPSLFDEQKKKPLREAIEFYKHKENWSNRLVAGDSLLVMNSLLEKEGMAGKVQMVYFDPPYGIKYGSNFQPFVNKRDVKDGKDEDLSGEPEMIKAFRDTWEMGIHSYLTYLRDRLLLAKELLHETGSIFVQISDENVHLVRNLLDEVFGVENFCGQITFVKTSGLTQSLLANRFDFLLWYAKSRESVKYRQIYLEKSLDTGTATNYNWLEFADGTRRGMTKAEKANYQLIPNGTKVYKPDNITSQGNPLTPFEFKGKTYQQTWKTNIAGMKKLAERNRLHIAANSLQYVRYIDDFPYMAINKLWDDTATGSFTDDKVYVVQTGTKTIQRCILMTTDPSDLVLDITCGSGTTAYVAEQWGRRWITCDTSRVALTLAKQRLMTSIFDYYELAHPEQGVSGGFKYKKVPHITLGSIANNEPAPEETLYDQPFTDTRKIRVTGAFTVEAVPAPVAASFDDVAKTNIQEADNSIARTGETLRQDEWRSELLRTGVRGKSGDKIEFTRVEPLRGTRHLQAEAETKEDVPKRVVICFGHEHAPLERRVVELALQEARSLQPKPEIILFCAFHFDPEARKDIEETQWHGVTLLEAQMNADLLTADLKKKRSSNESFWLIGQPDVSCTQITTGEDKGKYVVEVHGFDYYNSAKGTVESGSKGDIAMWMLDRDYDGRSIFPSQVFFPMAGAKEGWSKLAKNLKAEIDEEKIEAFRGTESLPFLLGANKTIAVKIIDSRGIESLKIIKL